MKKIIIMPVKNEEWVLEWTLACDSLFADHIIVADQNSTDRTAEICKRFPKVVYVKNESKEYNEGHRRQLLLDVARQFEGNNFIINLAADEILSANILKRGAFDRMVEGCQPGSSFALQWVQLWKGEQYYRDDNSVWARHYRPFAFIDDLKTNYREGFAHLSMIPEGLMESAKRVEEYKILHYQFVAWERMLAKQRWARVLEFDHNNKNSFIVSLRLNNKYYITKDETDMRLAPVLAQWHEGYMPFTPQEYQPKTDWHNNFIMQTIRKFGAERLKWLDIWDISWPGIVDPRSKVQKWYHNHQHAFGKLIGLVPKWLRKKL